MRTSHEKRQRAAHWAKRFVSDKRGSAAVIFALSSFVLFSTAGAGLDLARGMMVKSRLAGALDAAALAVGRTNGLSNNQMQALAQKYFDANYPATTLGTHTSVVVTTSGQTTNLSVTAAVPTTLLQLAGIPSVDLRVTNQVVRAVTKLRVALVLDNTGSMAQTDNTGTSKISALKTATHQLISQLQNAAITPGDVQVSIVPFSLDVNLASAIAPANATWIDWTDYDAAPPNSKPDKSYGPDGEAQNSDCPYSGNSSPYGYSCLYLSSGEIPGSGANKGRIYPGTDNGNYNPGRGGHHYNGYWDSVKKNSSCTSNCTYNHTWYTYNHDVKADLPLHGAWDGCFMDRLQPYDASNTTPVVSTPATLFPAEINEYCPTASSLSPLGYDWPSLNAKVDLMTPNGSTNQAIGLEWGWQSLTSTAPLNAPVQDTTTQNVIVLLSDGLNTQDRFDGDGSNQSATADARMAATCAAAKTAKVTIYTVLVMSGNSSVLQACASDSSKYFALSTAGAIVTAFATIGTQLANLHLSR